jgi:cytochrome c
MFRETVSSGLVAQDRGIVTAALTLIAAWLFASVPLDPPPRAQGRQEALPAKPLQGGTIKPGSNQEKAGPRLNDAEIDENSSDMPDNLIEEVEKVIGMLASADAGSGAQLFDRRCRVCHGNEKNGRGTVGPNLWGVVGRRKGVLQNYNYTQALRGKGGVWSNHDLAAYLRDTRAFIPGNKMIMLPITDLSWIADIIVYLNQLSDDPQRQRQN